MNKLNAIIIEDGAARLPELPFALIVDITHRTGQCG